MILQDGGGGGFLVGIPHPHTHLSLYEGGRGGGGAVRVWQCAICLITGTRNREPNKMAADTPDT